MLEKFKKLFTFEYFSVLIILIASFALRVFRVGKILGFYYDQGRDAQVIWDLFHLHKFFLIGPTTGLAGVFRGPFYYYLIAPFYWLGNGNPVYPAVFLAFLSTLALALLYYLGKQINGKVAGFIALIIGSFSFEIVYASRWLSNPTPMLLLSLVLVWMLFLIQDGKKWPWMVLSLVLGLSFFSFGSSGELFYFLAIFIFAIYFKKTPDLKTIIISSLIFLTTFSPLYFFNLKHGNILGNNVLSLLGNGKSFGIPSWQFAIDRLSLLSVYFASIIFHGPFAKEWLITFLLFLLFIYFLPKIIQNKRLQVLIILIGSVFFGTVFFVGNGGNFYQYYLTGYYLIFTLLLSAFLSILYSSKYLGRIFVVLFLLVFLSQNWNWIKPYINTDGTDADTIILANQKLAIDWVYQNAGSRDFNVDVYVPPVISYSYDYLFTWLGTTKYHKLPLQPLKPLLYTMYEVDPPHPERIKAWLDRQNGIGRIIKQETFGGITVQERIRYTK